MDNNSLYISSSYRWARPLTDIFGKRVVAHKEFIEKGDYYISHGNQPYLLSKDFIEVYRGSYIGDYLEHSKTFPPRVKKMELSLKIYKIAEIGPRTFAKVRGEYLIDIGEEDIGLLAGFDKARRFSGIEGTARWTFSEARVVIPWPGETLTIMAGGMPKDAGESIISLYINDQPIVEDYRIDEEMKEYVFRITGISGGRRAVLRIKSTTWSPNKYGIKGYPDGLGVLLDWVKVKR